MYKMSSSSLLAFKYGVGGQQGTQWFKSVCRLLMVLLRYRDKELIDVQL